MRPNLQSQYETIMRLDGLYETSQFRLNQSVVPILRAIGTLPDGLACILQGIVLRMPSYVTRLAISGT